VHVRALITKSVGSMWCTNDSRPCLLTARLSAAVVPWLPPSWILVIVCLGRFHLNTGVALNPTQEAAGRAGSKCCQIEFGILEPVFYNVSDGLSSIQLTMSSLAGSNAEVKDKICIQPQGKLSLRDCNNAEYRTSDDHTVFKLLDVKTLPDDICEGDEAIKECGDFDEWKIVLVENGLQTSRSDAAFPDLAAKDWGTSKYQSESLWGARKRFVGERYLQLLRSGGERGLEHKRCAGRRGSTHVLIAGLAAAEQGERVGVQT